MYDDNSPCGKSSTALPIRVWAARPSPPIRRLPDPPFREVFLLRQPLFHLLSPSSLPWASSSLTPAAPIVPSPQLRPVCAIPSQSFLSSLPPSPPPFFFFLRKFSTQKPLYSSSPNSTLSLSPCSFSFILLFFISSTLTPFPPSHYHQPPPTHTPPPHTSFHFCFKNSV